MCELCRGYIVAYNLTDDEQYYKVQAYREVRNPSDSILNA